MLTLPHFDLGQGLYMAGQVFNGSTLPPSLMIIIIGLRYTYSFLNYELWHIPLDTLLTMRLQPQRMHVT